MAFSSIFPKNSESRAISLSITLLKKNAPHVKRVVSFADGCQSWDGTIYRAAWFELTNIARKKKTFYILPNGESFTTLTIKLHWYAWWITKYITKQEFDNIFGSKFNNTKSFDVLMAKIWAKELDGFSLRYIKHLKPWLQRNYTILPYSKIKEVWASMYLGKKRA